MLRIDDKSKDWIFQLSGVNSEYCIKGQLGFGSGFLSKVKYSSVDSFAYRFRAVVPEYIDGIDDDFMLMLTVMEALRYFDAKEDLRLTAMKLLKQYDRYEVVYRGVSEITQEHLKKRKMTHHVYATQFERFEVGIEYELWKISDGPEPAMLIVGNAWGEKVCVPMEYFVPCGIFKEKAQENFQRRRW